MSKTSTFAGLTGAKLGDGKPGPAETETSTTTESEDAKAVEENVAENNPNGEQASAPEPSDDSVIFTCHPVVNMNLGKYQFRQGQLRLDSNEVEEFEALVEQQPPQIRHSIKKIDSDAAHDIARKFAFGKQTAGVDTTANALDAPNARPFAG